MSDWGSVATDPYLKGNFLEDHGRRWSWQVFSLMMISGGCGGGCCGGHHPLFFAGCFGHPSQSWDTAWGKITLISFFLWVSHSGCFWASFLVESHDLVLFPMPLFGEFGFWMYWFKLPVILFPHSPTLTPISPFLRFDRTKQFPPWKNPDSLWMELWFIIQVASQLRIDSIIRIFFIDQGKTLAKPFLIFTTSTA